MLTGRIRVTLFLQRAQCSSVPLTIFGCFQQGARIQFKHTRQGLRVLLVFNQGNFSEESTLLLSECLKRLRRGFCSQGHNDRCRDLHRI